MNSRLIDFGTWWTYTLMSIEYRVTTTQAWQMPGASELWHPQLGYAARIKGVDREGYRKRKILKYLALEVC